MQLNACRKLPRKPIDADLSRLKGTVSRVTYYLNFGAHRLSFFCPNLDQASHAISQIAFLFCDKRSRDQIKPPLLFGLYRKRSFLLDWQLPRTITLGRLFAPTSILFNVSPVHQKMPSEIKDIKKFIEISRRKDAKCKDTFAPSFPTLFFLL